MTTTLIAQPLTAEAFAPFGDVIESRGDASAAMNSGAFERFHTLANIDPGPDSHSAIGIVRAIKAQSLPYRVPMMERHPLGSQAFIPKSQCAFVLVVAATDQPPEPNALQAFVSNGKQGINYHRGTWHMPLIALSPGQEFIVVDRADGVGNLDEFVLREMVLLNVQESPD